MDTHKNEKILELEIRKEIFDFIEKHPGIHVREIERIIKIPYSTLSYHLHFLNRHGLITEKKLNGRAEYYSKNVILDDLEIISLLRQKNVRKILLFLVGNKKATFGEIVRFLGLSASTVSWYLVGLVKKKIVKKNIVGREVNYEIIYDKNKIIMVLIAHRESFLDKLVDKTIEMWEIG